MVGQGRGVHRHAGDGPRRCHLLRQMEIHRLGRVARRVQLGICHLLYHSVRMARLIPSKNEPELQAERQKSSKLAAANKTYEERLASAEQENEKLGKNNRALKKKLDEKEQAEPIPDKVYRGKMKELKELKETFKTLRIVTVICAVLLVGALVFGIVSMMSSSKLKSKIAETEQQLQSETKKAEDASEKVIELEEKIEQLEVQLEEERKKEEDEKVPEEEAIPAENQAAETKTDENAVAGTTEENAAETETDENAVAGTTEEKTLETTGDQNTVPADTDAEQVQPDSETTDGQQNINDGGNSDNLMKPIDSGSGT